MIMLSEACEETLPAVAELAAGVTRSPAPDGDGASADGSGERRRWSLMQGVGSRRLHLVRPRVEAHLPQVCGNRPLHVARSAAFNWITQPSCCWLRGASSGDTMGAVQTYLSSWVAW